VANFTAGTSFTDGVTNDVTAAKLNALVADAVPTSNLSLNSTTGTIANFTASTANITLGTIPALTAGTTTGTAGIFTSGTIQSLTSSTANITSGTFGGSINSTTGTIGNLSTTLAGDFTISQGTATLGTTGATAATYGTTSDIPRITVDAKGRVTSATTVTAPVGFRNRIINGDMRIDQRNVGASVTPTNDGQYTLDRWSVRLSQASKISVQRNAGSVTPPVGYTNYIGVTSLSSYTVSISDYFALVQYVEGFNMADLGFGSSGASSVTLSFWVRSSLTGTFGGSIENADVNRSYPFTFSILSANTWEKKSITISGDTSGTWGNDNGIGLRIHFGLGVGSASNRSNTAGSWVSAESFSATGATSVVGTNGATFYITGVQLEAGSTATDFERRPIGTELALCQRYFFNYDASVNLTSVASGSIYGSTTIARVYMQFPATMRTTPTLSLGGQIGCSGGNSDETVSSILVSYGGYANALIDLNLNSAATNGHGKVIYLFGTGYIRGNAEL